MDILEKGDIRIKFVFDLSKILSWTNGVSNPYKKRRFLSSRNIKVNSLLQNDAELF